MLPITVPNRPFSSDLITGLVLPDGIFEAALGQQRINAHFNNVGNSTLNDINIYVEAVSHPGILLTTRTHKIPSFDGGATRSLSWEADFSAAPPGQHFISFVAETPTDRTRVIKKVFVTKVGFDPSTKTFSIDTPEGSMGVRFGNVFAPQQTPCDFSQPTDENIIDLIGRLFQGHDPDFRLCLTTYLLENMEVAWTPSKAYPGQYGDLPFQDPWWKVVLAVVVVVLPIAAAIVEANSGSGSVDVTVTEPPPPGTCCGVTGSGGGTSYVAAGLVAAAAAAATVCVYSDERDAFRRGQDNTPPADGEFTESERIIATFNYPEPVALGRPFAVGVDWEYTRITTGQTYNHSDSEINTNTHVLSRYEITAPDVIAQGTPFIVEGSFFDENGDTLRGDQLFVQCFLCGPEGQYRSLVMQDDGVNPDGSANDGVYTGSFLFRREEKPQGLWEFFVIAQDVNSAQPGMDPEEAAKLIGGMVLTHQLTITFGGGTCPLVPDGRVQVL